MLLGICVFVHLFVWGGLAGAIAISPPDDSLEQILLSQELRLEYGKHPPLPTWILFAVSRAFGPSIASTYWLGAASSVLTVLLLYRFAAPLVGAPRAALASVLALNVEYMNAGTAYFNHNTVQLPLAVLTIALFHRSLVKLKARHWAVFGLACGAMLLAKFSAVVLFASFGVYLVWAGQLRNPAVARGIALAAFVAVVVISPYLLAVRSDAWSPNAYAMNSLFPSDVTRLECLKTVWGFASSQAAKVAPAVLVFFFARGRAQPMPSPVFGEDVALTPFLTIVGFGPTVLTVVVATLSGAYLLVGWGTTFHVMLTLWLVGARPFATEPSPAVLRRATLATALVQLLLFGLVVSHGGRLPSLNRTPHPLRPLTPVDLAKAIDREWYSHCDAPLRFVLTDAGTGAALALHYSGSPQVVDAMRPEHEKFFTPNQRDADGAVVVARESNAPLGSSGALGAMIASAAWVSVVALPGRDGKIHRFSLGVVAPSTGQGCAFATQRIQ